MIHRFAINLVFSCSAVIAAADVIYVSNPILRRSTDVVEINEWYAQKGIVMDLKKPKRLYDFLDTVIESNMQLCAVYEETYALQDIVHEKTPYLYKDDAAVKILSKIFKNTSDVYGVVAQAAPISYKKLKKLADAGNESIQEKLRIAFERKMLPPGSPMDKRIGILNKMREQKWGESREKILTRQDSKIFKKANNPKEFQENANNGCVFSQQILVREWLSKPEEFNKLLFSAHKGWGSAQNAVVDIVENGKNGKKQNAFVAGHLRNTFRLLSFFYQ